MGKLRLLGSVISLGIHSSYLQFSIGAVSTSWEETNPFGLDHKLISGNSMMLRKFITFS